MNTNNSESTNTQSCQTAVSVSVMDLRIGNLIYYNGNNKSVGKISLLVSDLIGALDHCQLDYRRNKKHWLINLDPIPLTEEWLGNFNWNGYNPLHFNSNFEIDNKGRLYCNGDYKGVNINYVHQLQNLYFALTGRELTER